MNDNVTVIDIIAQVTDDTAAGVRSATSTVSKLEAAMKRTQQQIDGLRGKSKIEIVAGLKDMAMKGLQGITNAAKSLGGKVRTVTMKLKDLVTAPFRGIAKMLSNPIVQIASITGVTLGAKDIIDTFKGFEQGMANVKAISNATDEDMQKLTQTAKDLGDSTMFSAAQASEAMENLAMAGWKTNDIIAGMPGLLNLAAAGSVNLATASGVVSTAMSQFEKQGVTANRIADIPAATATNSKTDITGLGESLKYAGSMAGQLGYSMEDTALAFALMGNNSIDASSAGTSLRAIMARMAKQDGMTAEETNAVSEAMKKLGVLLTDGKGEMKPLIQVMSDLRTGFKGISNEAERTAIASNLAGMYGSGGLLAIVGASDEKFNQLADAINNSTGAAQKMAGIKMDTLQGSMLYLQSAAEGVKIAIGERLQPYLKGFIDWLTARMPDIKTAAMKALDFLDEKINQVKKSIETMAASPEWQNAETMWDKIKVAWHKLIAEPFDAWRSGTGKTWLADKMNGIGKGIGGAIKSGILTLLGVETGDALTEGADIGRSFMEGFLEGFDGKKVADAIWNAIKGIGKDAATLLPGGKEASSTAPLSAALVGYAGLKGAKTAHTVYKGGKAIINGGKGIFNAVKGLTAVAPAVTAVGATGIFGGIKTGSQIFKAANAAKAGEAAQSALAFAKAGQLGKAYKSAQRRQAERRK